MKNFIYIAMAILSAFTVTNCTPDQQKELLAKIANQTLRGEGAPAPDLGVIGNYYFDEKNSDLYGPKTAEGWGKPVSLKDFKGAKGDKGDKGEPGANGTKIYTGEGKPSDEIGAVGDWYFDTKTKTFYGPKTVTGWPTSHTKLGANEDKKDQPITAADYELSPDGKTLVNWKNNKTKNLNMQADPVLKNITVIDIDAFNGVKLTTLVLPDGLKTIKRKAFYKNELTTLVIPNGVTIIEKEAFYNNLLTTVNLPNGLTKIERSTFENNKLSAISIPNSITEIGNGSFAGNQLTTLTIPASVKTIKGAAFYNNKLISVIIPEGVEVIDNNVFDANKLRSITLPSTLTKIGYRCFFENRLEIVTFEGTTPPINNTNVFEDNSLQHIYVPAGSVEAYKTAFSEYENYISAK